MIEQTEGVGIEDLERSLLRGWSLRRTRGSSAEVIAFAERLLEAYPDEPRVALFGAQASPKPPGPSTNSRYRELLERSVRGAPEPYAMISLAGALLADEPERARELYDSALKLPPTVEHRFMIYRSVGIVGTGLGEHEDVISALVKAKRFRPDAGELDAMIARAQFALKRLSAARASCKRAVAAPIPDMRGYRILGEILRELGQVEQAIATYQEAATRIPDEYWPHYELGWLYLYTQPTEALPEAVRARRWELAIEAFDACLARNPPKHVVESAEGRRAEALSLADLSEGVNVVPR